MRVTHDKWKIIHTKNIENVSKLLILLLYAYLRQFFTNLQSSPSGMPLFLGLFYSQSLKKVLYRRIIVQFLGNFSGCILRNFFTFVILFCNKKIFDAFLDMFSFHRQKRDKGRDHVIIYNTASVHATFKKKASI